MNEWIEKARRIDFDRLDTLVSEHIAVLKLYVENIDKDISDKGIHNEICRDLVFPCISLLTEFLECIKISERK